MTLELLEIPRCADFHHDFPVRRAHLVGICGAGMRALALGLLSQGVHVSGSDKDTSKGTDLADLGAVLHQGHAAEHLDAPDVVVYSTAISEANPEIRAAREAGIPIVHRSEMLGWFLARKESILIAGTHGKTTTSALCSLLLQAAGENPWSFVGGYVREFRGNTRVGGDRWAVAEADESDGSFLNLPRRHAIITNIEPEHLNFWGTEQVMFEGFSAFVGGIPEGGNVVVCSDDPGIRRLMGATGRGFVTYSVSDSSADYYARGVRLTGAGSSFDLVAGRRVLGTVELAIPGLQNVANALAAHALVLSLGVPFEKLQGALRSFHGVDRRFTRYEAAAGFLVVDDYGHHPTEVRATVRAARLLAEERGGRLTCVFQPHRYSRTQDFFQDFGPALAATDTAIIMDVYAAGEEPIAGINGAALAELARTQIASEVLYLNDFAEIKKTVLGMSKKSDVVLLLGAGTVTNLAPLLASAPVP